MRCLIYLFIVVNIIFFSIPLIAEDVLSVSLYTWDDATPDVPFDTPAVGLQFPGAKDATVEEPWQHSPQFIRLIYSSDAAFWGIRIVTNNEVNIGQVYPRPQYKGPDGKWEFDPNLHPDWGGKYKYENGQWLTGDDSVSFGGLIDPATKSNPELRADLAWQVFKDPELGQPDPIWYNQFGGWYGYWNVGSNPIKYKGVWKYPYDWAYIVDKSNKWNGESSIPGPDEDSIYYTGTWAARYEMVVTGNPVTNYLTQYPPMQQTNPDIRLGDCDVVVYIAACFGVMQNGEFVDTIPKGNYQTIIYFELVHE